MTEPVEGASTYASSGVDIAAGERAVELIKGRLTSTRPEVVGGLGGFAGLFRLDARRLLATSTDGVGTKVAIAQAMDIHDTIGFDLVGMVVDDLVVCGAEPLFMTDYIACGQVVPERIAAIVAGIDAGCALAGCALIGGETAEHPGLLGLRTTTTSRGCRDRRMVVQVDSVLGPALVRAGATWWWRWRRVGCTPTGTRWRGTCCSTPAGSRSTRRPSLGFPSGRCCWSRPGSMPRTAWLWRPWSTCMPLRT